MNAALEQRHEPSCGQALVDKLAAVQLFVGDRHYVGPGVWPEERGYRTVCLEDLRPDFIDRARIDVRSETALQLRPHEGQHAAAHRCQEGPEECPRGSVEELTAGHSRLLWGDLFYPEDLHRLNGGRFLGCFDRRLFDFGHRHRSNAHRNLRSIRTPRPFVHLGPPVGRSPT